jgi:hypothetical protein
MSEVTRKKRFQIHLSTAVTLTIVAGGIVGLNVRAAFIPIEEGGQG